MANTKPRPSTLLGAAVALTAAGLLLALPLLPALAQGAGGTTGPNPDPTGLDTTGAAAGFNLKSDVVVITGLIIEWGLGILGIVFFLFILVGGYLWLTAGSNEEKVKKAKMIIGAAISGLLILFISYILALAVVDVLIGATSRP